MSKVLNVSNIYFTLPYFLGNQLYYFKNRGYEIHLICSPASQLPKFSKSHFCKYKEIEIIRTFGVFADLKSLLGIYKYIRKYGFDIVSGHTPKAGMLSMLAAKLAGVKKRIYFRHGLVYETSTGIKRKILIYSEKLASACATQVVCVSPYLVDRSINDGLGNKSKLRILNIGSCTGIDAKVRFNPYKIDKIEKENLRAKLDIDENNFVIGFVGRLVGDKGIVELVEAFERIYETNNNARLLLVGPLEARDAVPERIVEKIKGHRGIIHAGLVEDNIPIYYSLMNIFVLPTHREGLGVALLEAQSMGLPVLTTSHTGARDAIIKDVTGDYIKMTAESVYNSILRYMDNTQLCRKMGENGRRFVMDNFSEEIIWKEIEKLYEQ